MTYDYTDHGTITDDDGGRAQVRGLHHPADDDRRAQYEVRIDASAQLDLADPAQRAQIETLVVALQTAIAHGESVGWLGVPAERVTVIRPAAVEWTSCTASGASLRVSDK